MSDTASGRPWQLDDRDWLAARCLEVGTRTIAKELGVARDTVERARRDLGIPAQAVGRRRGRSLNVVPPAAPERPAVTGTITLTGTAGLLLERFQRESRTGGPAATEELLIARIRAAHDARENRDQIAYEDALLGIASAAALVHQHEQRLRKAA